MCVLGGGGGGDLRPRIGQALPGRTSPDRAVYNRSKYRSVHDMHTVPADY